MGFKASAWNTCHDKELTGSSGQPFLQFCLLQSFFRCFYAPCFNFLPLPCSVLISQRNTLMLLLAECPRKGKHEVYPSVSSTFTYCLSWDNSPGSSSRHITQIKILHCSELPSPTLPLNNLDFFYKLRWLCWKSLNSVGMMTQAPIRSPWLPAMWHWHMVNFPSLRLTIRKVGMMFPSLLAGQDTDDWNPRKSVRDECLRALTLSPVPSVL